MNQKLKESRGITLIALVITIIVLLILAGVTINMVLGEDGIIAQAKAAQQAQNQAEKDEQDALEDLEEKLRIEEGKQYQNQEGTAENLVKTNELKVGDYIKYTYTGATYTTPTKASGKSVHDNGKTETYDSNAGAYIEDTKWRVLSVNNGVVKLIPELASVNESGEVVKNLPQLEMYGEGSYLNAETVLNEMCKTLYSGEYGTARSIRVDDINDKVLYKGTVYYKKNGANTDEFIDETKKGNMTFGELEKAVYEDGKIKNRTVPGGGDISKLKVNYYQYRLYRSTADNEFISTKTIAKWLNNNPLSASKDSTTYDVISWDMLGKHTMKKDAANVNYTSAFASYWLADTTGEINLYDNIEDSYIKYCIRIINQGQLGRRNMCNSKGDIETDTLDAPMCVMPVVTLKAGLELNDTETEIDGSTVWEIK